ncbi:MAG: hypothetical protein J0H49_07105 [Acidobacteria bacterium]|nr:hypothetical protein [Acidobacteriota bacterium]
MTKPKRNFLARLAAAVILCVLPASAQSPSHLPLVPGAKWVLTNPAGQSMTFEVVGREGSAFRVRWQNPWNTADFVLEPSGNKVILKGLDMGQGMANMPPNCVYYDFDLPQGGKWSNALGNLEIQSRGRQVVTAAGTYTDTIEVRSADKKGFSTYFTFARNVGYVQFGRGSGTFLLQSFTPGSGAIRETRETAAPRSRETRNPNATRSTYTATGNGRFLVGLDSNPSPNEGYSNEANDRRFSMSVNAGMTMTFLHPKWDELEPRGGDYTFDQVEFRRSLADKNNIPILLNLRMIDGPNRAMPSQYRNWKFDDPRLTAKLQELLRRFSPAFRRRVKWVSIGNEVDHYFESHKNEIQAYSTLISNVLPTVRELFPGAPFTVNFSDQRLGDFDRYYKPILSQVDFYSYNYYPINADFTFRDPAGSRGDLERMIAAAGQKPVFFQELGYSSSTKLGSSEDKQAQFIQVVFDTLRQHPGRIIGANFNWMSDLPDSVVDQLSRYYKTNGENFKQFLGTLGWFTKEGKPKKAWSTFQQVAR